MFGGRLLEVVRLDLDRRRRSIVRRTQIGEDGDTAESQEKNRDYQSNATPDDTPMIEMQCGIKQGIHVKKRVKAVGTGRLYHKTNLYRQRGTNKIDGHK